jgi:16S rRNA (cytidine1402-2'-O)-methyltransferase
MANFYVIGTPIGNLEDITLRALRIFKEVDLVLCEDTRVTKRLFERHAISTPTMSYHAHSTLAKIDTIISMLEEGKSLALVSDAGTPGISDPGSLLVSKIREHFSGDNRLAVDGISEKVTIESVPGPSALTAALSIAGIPIHEFTFLGFLPHKKGRETLFKEIAMSDRAVVFYESPHRIEKALESLTEHLAAESGRSIIVARELTKIFEEIVRGTPAELAAYYAKNQDKVRGEFVVIVAGAQG